METRLLTYDELASALGITAASAKRLAIRRKWSKSPGNDGRSRVSVPVERLTARSSDVTPDTSDITDDDADETTRDDAGDVTTVVTVLTRHIERLESERERLTAKVASVEAERDAERARATDLAIQVGAVEPLKQTVQALRDSLDREKDRAAEIRRERDRWQTEANRPRGIRAWFTRSA